ncbi:MAG TPA: glycosyltransferase [Acidimicrobiales bacterium]|nr:glycosyltransferase [Acidimicrobiales bacterium]
MTPAGPGLIAALHAGRATGPLAPTVVSLRRAHPGLTVVVGTADGSDSAGVARLGADVVAAPSAAALVRATWAAHRCHVLAVTEPAVFPPEALGPALRLVEGDMRVATVSFLCNAASFLSFPYRNHAVSHQVESLDEEAITRLLRTTGPVQRPVPLPFATGPAVLLSSYALSAVGGPEDAEGGRPAVALADFSLQARRRGFLDVADPSTFVSRPYDLGPLEDPWLTTAEHQWLQERHPFVSAILEEQVLGEDSALATVLAASRAKVLGLRLLVDGSCLGTKQMGTQVQTISLVGALTRRPDVERVAVSLATSIPPYAREILSHPKVDARFVGDGDVSCFGRVDVAHRPFQPVEPLHRSWFDTAARTVVTIQDLMSYHVGAYHESPGAWLDVRAAMRQVLAEVDGVVAISHDVRRHLDIEHLPVEPQRVAVVENGTDHLHGDETEAVPQELLARGFVAGEFALVLGTNYAHKNRDLAVEAVEELRRRGRDLVVVLAGAAVPHGSSRVREAEQGVGAGHLVSIPDVPSEERNWLLHHASVVLYPTSAEGFGLIPYEAARFGTATVLVPFGPLGEVMDDLPVQAADWSPRALADAAEALLDDPGTARLQVEAALRSGQDFTWDATAAKLVDVYRSLLAAPARGGDARR